LLRAEAARDSAKNKDKGVIVLKRRRPVVGMVLEGEENAILVQRITPGGPAEKAGLKVGDRVVAAGGVNIRSVYQAVLPTLYKQPGDTMDFLVERGGRTHDCRVTLGGGVEVASAPYEQLGNLIQPKLEIGRDAKGSYYANRPGNTTAEVFSPPFPAEPQDPPRVTSADKIALLEKAIERYQRVIEIQQLDLARREADRLKTEQLLRSLQSDLSTLRQQLKPAK
jgi:membrane-associated protease RseP (regulator of RpoE activity)